ncbi:MAG TPA: response regulator transcription factor [Gemmataceae bacterium]|jgi:two-component system response regulator CpxR|nr:response regulator transcription factor [Gemmataceae bacterium]
MATSDKDLIPLLLIDDDVELGDMMKQYFASHGFRVSPITRGSAGLEKALAGDFALVILDVMLPGMDGFNVLRQLRKRSATPVIMLTGRVTENDRITGLDAGADDYLTKPFGPAELLARVRAVLRRAGRNVPAPTETYSVGRLRLAPADRTVWVDNKEVILTESEFAVLDYLVRAVGRVVTRQELMTVLYQCDYTPYDRSLDVHVSHLRKKLSEHGTAIRTIRGEGYAFSDSDAKQP